MVEPDRDLYGPLRVLVIEEQVYVRRVILEILRNIGFKEVQEVRHGAAGLIACRKIPPDIIICDIEMEKMDGLTFLENLRKLPHLDRVPVIFLTRHTDAPTVQWAKALGPSAFMVKPPTLKGLKDRIDHVLTRL